MGVAVTDHGERGCVPCVPAPSDGADTLGRSGTAAWLGRLASALGAAGRPGRLPTLSAFGTLFRWLIERRYPLANLFFGIKVRDTQRASALDTSHAFTEG